MKDISSSITSLSEKECRALIILRKALSGKNAACVLYLADDSSNMLLHLLKRAGNGRISVPVVTLQLQPLPKETFCFSNKMARILGFNADVVRLPVKPGGLSYTEEEILELVERILRRRGVTRIISSDRRHFERGGYYLEWGGFMEFRPLYEFDEKDIKSYIEFHGLPLCSLHKKQPCEVENRKDAVDAAALRKKLASLGYL